MTPDAASSKRVGWVDEALALGEQISPSELLVTAEAAALLRIDERHVRRLVRSERLPHVRLGRQLLFRRESLLAWLREREVPVKEIGDRRRKDPQKPR